jgi:hypothetical protein
MSVTRYGCTWEDTDLQIELWAIRAGGKWMHKGKECGEGLFTHYRNAFSLLWPTDDHHRWSDLGLRRICENEINVFLGASDTSKTYLLSRFIVTDWWANPHNTLWMVSSTELRGAELRILGVLKGLFNRARELHPWLPGRYLEGKHAFVNDDESDDEARMLTKGIIFIPCKSNNSWVGMGAYCGVKPQKGGRLGHAGDEVSFMQPSFLDAYSNWYGKENFKGLLSANPTDLEDPSCIASEPIEGWENWHDTEKTQEWRSKWYDAWVTCFDGRDTPNNDFPGPKPRYPYLIGNKKMDAVAKAEGGRDSDLWMMQCAGKPRPGAEKMKVITRQMCENNKTFEDVIWSGKPRIQIVGNDAAYMGVGGDRNVLVRVEFGEDVEGKSVLSIHPPVIVTISAKDSRTTEDKIADFVKTYCEGVGCPPENFFFDARATLAVAYAKVWSPLVNAVDFGGSPTDRPVSLDDFVWDGEIKTRRLKTCKEHYSKFVSELWFTIHYAILSQQIRNMPKEVASEGYKRLWKYTKGNRIEIETKAEMKARTQQSPDLFDALVTAVEGARRRGFNISKLANPEDVGQDRSWLSELNRQAREKRKSAQLDYASA